MSATCTVPAIEIDEITTGRVFIHYANSHRSALGYYPMAHRTSYAAILTACGRFATMDDRAADLAAAIVSRVGTGLNIHQMLAAVADAMYQFQSNEWFDTATASGPEGERRSAHTHENGLREGVLSYLLLAEINMNVEFHGSVAGVPWVLPLLLDEVGVSLSFVSLYFPQVAKRMAA